VAFSLIARILGAAVSVYMLACAARILMSWLPELGAARAGALLARAVDPYLGWFRRFPFLSAGKFDFSPIAAVAVLAVLNRILATLAYAGSISVGVVLGLLLGAAWSAVAFLLGFLALCALARIVAYAARWNSLHPLWRAIDEMLNPVLYRITRIIYRNRIVHYLQGLVTGLVILAALRAAGDELVRLLARLLARLPF